MLRSVFFGTFTLAALSYQTGDSDARASLPTVGREEMIATAKLLQEHAWVCREENTRAACVANYRSDFTAGQTVMGVAYDWGGFDAPADFDRRLTENEAAGSHSRDGVTPCTTGIDCSGFVSRCWGQKKKYGTATLEEIAVRPRYNWFEDMKPGDVLNKPGSHVVLFVEYRRDGNPTVYEASGSHGRVILNRLRTWADLRGYFPLQYKAVREE